MKTLLLINSSGRVTRSITRRLTGHFATAWKNHHPGGTILERDLGLNPPQTVTEEWMAAAFAAPSHGSAETPRGIQSSETFIEEIVAADAIVLGAPIYNFGMPAALKAYFDQIIRVGRTFDLEPADLENPYRPLLTSKPVIVAVSAGTAAMHPGGAMVQLNFLEPHLRTLLGFIGLTDVTFVRVGDEEIGGDGLSRSLALAEEALNELAAGISAPVATNR